MPSRVYVIELDRAAGRRRDPRIPWVYVGSSARSAKERFAQHRRGYKSSGLVKRFAVRLRPDLYEDLGPFKGSKQACRAEQERARELAGCGFVAHSDGTSFGKGQGDWMEWDAARLKAVLGRVDAAAADLAESSFGPLTSLRCAQLLHGELGFWVSDFIDPLDPPPGYGRFAHVQLGVLERRVEQLGATGELPILATALRQA
jgi:hypothetical protein